MRDEEFYNLILEERYEEQEVSSIDDEWLHDFDWSFVTNKRVEEDD